jgi:hypothetical protein
MNNRIEKLFGLSGDPAAFEAERLAIIEEMLNSIHEQHSEKFEKCRALQAEIDAARARMSPEKFMSYLGIRIQENLADLTDQLQAVQTIAEKGSDHHPHLDAINKIALATGNVFGQANK